MIPLTLLAPTSAFSLPTIPIHRSSGSSYGPREIALLSHHSGYSLQGLALRNGQKKAEQQDFPSCLWLGCLCLSSFSLSGSEKLLPTLSGRVFQVCRVQLWCAVMAAPFPTAQGQCGAKQHLLLPTDPCWNHTSPTCLSFTFPFI